MLTRRGLWFFLTIVVICAVALARGTPGASLLCLTLLLWFLGSWFLFQVRTILVHGKLRVVREVADLRGPVPSLWAGRTFAVRVRLVSDAAINVPYAIVRERVPLGLERVDGATHAEGPLAASAPLEMRYRVHCKTPGRVRFEGLIVESADFQGFFYRRWFVQGVELYRVLPALADARGRFPTVKRHNLLPLSGAHRHPRPGTGSELLDLRDYLPGDPPKVIAWKASARRDRLMTKEFESEVPIRCTLFVDTSNSVRVGLPGQNALTRLVEITAAVAQANAAARDLTGVCLFDDRATLLVKAARGPRHLIQLLEILADAAMLTPATGAMAVEQVLPLAYGLAEEVYPHLVEPDTNGFPWWLPLWAPQPAYTLRRPASPRGTSFRGLKEWARAGAAMCRQNLVVRFSAAHHQRARWRKQVAAIVSARYGLGPGMLPLLLENDEQLVLHAQRFLNEHHVSFELPLYGPKHEYLWAAPEKIAVAAAALRHAVGRGRDNELFVVLADVLEMADQLDPLLAAVKMAKARHHFVMLVCPWPPHVPPPARQLPKPDQVPWPPEVLRLHQAYYRMRHAFVRLGVPVTCASQNDAVPSILNRLDRMRGLARGVR